MLFNAANVEKYQIKRRKKLRAMMVREGISYIKQKIKYKIDHGYDSYAFTVDRIGYDLGFTYKEFKEPFYSEILPYFQERGFKFDKKNYLEGEGYEMTWSK